MNISKNFKMMSVFALASAFATASQANDLRPEFVTTDQPFVILKAIKGGKYPFMFKCHPGMNQLDVVYLGTEKKSGIQHIKKEQELEKLTPIRHTFKLADNTAVQVDKKYPGYRESYLAAGLESVFKAVGMYPSSGYKGTVLVDEYKAGLPMKWALCNVQAFKALKKYVIKSFAAANVVASEVKPLLLVEIADNKDNLDASDYDFLNAYFEVLDPKDPNVKKFFYEANEAINNIEETVKFLTVGASLGEAVLDTLDGHEALKGFEGLKMRDAFCLSILGTLSGLAIKEIGSAAKGIADDYMVKKGISKGDLAKAAIISLGAPAGIYLAYKIITSMLPEDEDDADELVEAVEETKEVQA